VRTFAVNAIEDGPKLLGRVRIEHGAAVVSVMVSRHAHRRCCGRFRFFTGRMTWCRVARWRGGFLAGHARKSGDW